MINISLRDHMKRDLKPCPFCGKQGPVVVRHIETSEAEGFYCLRCKAVVKWPSMEMNNRETFGEWENRLADCWNRRAT